MIHLLDIALNGLNARIDGDDYVSSDNDDGGGGSSNSNSAAGTANAANPNVATGNKNDTKVPSLTPKQVSGINAIIDLGLANFGVVPSKGFSTSTMLDEVTITATGTANQGKFYPDGSGGNKATWQPLGAQFAVQDGIIQNYWLSNDHSQVKAVFSSFKGQVSFPGVTIVVRPILGGMSGNGTIEVPSSFMLAGLEHEYGHYLDQLLNGSFRYNFDVAPSSLFNQIISPSTHDDYWTEVEANQLAVKFFGPNSAIATTPGYPTK